MLFLSGKKSLLIVIVLTTCIITFVNFVVIPSDANRSVNQLGHQAQKTMRTNENEHKFPSLIFDDSPGARCGNICRLTCPGQACDCELTPFVYVKCGPLNGTAKGNKTGQLRRANTDNAKEENPVRNPKGEETVATARTKKAAIVSLPVWP